MEKIFNFVLIVSLLYLTLMHLNYKEKTKLKIDIITTEQELIFKDLFFYKDYFESNNSINFMIKDVLCISSKHEKVFISDIIRVNNKPCLIYRLSEFSCTNYFQETIKHLNDLYNSDQNVMILYSYRMGCDFVFFIKSNKINIPIYKIPHSWNIAQTLDNTHYFFVGNPDLSMSDIYIYLMKILLNKLIYI